MVIQMSNIREKGDISQKDVNKEKGKRQLLDTDTISEKSYCGQLGKINNIN